MDRDTELKVLREDLMNELDAINLYQAHIQLVSDPQAKELLAHIRDEEKEHVAELTAIIRRLDPAQETAFAAEHTLSLLQGTSITARASETSEAETSDNPPRLTVGSLMEK